MRVLNVGGGERPALPEHFKGWEQVVLDINADAKPDILLDAKDLCTLEPSTYDAVLCSHNLEHFYKHDVPIVLKGMLHVLKETGFAEIVVPDINCLFEAMRRESLELGDVWYRTAAGVPITFHDVLYGWNHAMERGNLYYAHKCGFTQHSLGEALLAAGFKGAHIWTDNKAILARAFKQEQPCP